MRELEGSTNTDAPFQPGEIVSFADDQYIVLRNDGASGTVRGAGPDGTAIERFYWLFGGEEARRTGARMDLPACCCEGVGCG